MTVSRSPWIRFTARVRAVLSTICSLAVMTGFGWFLVRLSGWPLPDHWPSHTEWDTFLADPLHGSFLRDLGACTGWLLLLLVVTAIAIEILARITRHRFPRLRLHLPAPLRALAAGIVGASIIGLLTGPAHAKPATSGPAQQPPAATALAAPATLQPAATTATVTRPSTVTFVIRGQRYHVIIRRGDTMSKIARQWLGDPDRWPEICRLNRHRHFATGGTLRDCDLIYPRWDLKLPADAIPPPGATPAHGTAPKPPTATPPITDPELPPRQPARPSSPAPSPTTPATIDPDSVINLEPPPASSPTSGPIPTSVGAPASESNAEHGGADSWLTYTLAAALVAVAVLVARRRLLAHRGRRTRPNRRGLLQRPLPYIASLARHLAHRQNTEPPPGVGLTSDNDPSTTAPGDDPTQPHTPAQPAAIGLTGPGAPAAARAAIIAALSPAGDNPPGHVITTRDALETLLDGHTPDTTWTRLHVADTITDALDQLHAQILHTRRSHNLTADAGAPRILLVTPPPAGVHTGRLQALLDTAEAVVTARILGDWPDVQTIGADGTTDAGPRQPVLTVADTIDALNLIREATTGPATAPPPIPPPEPATGISTGQPAAGTEPTTARSTSAGSADSEKAHVRVLGAIHFGPERDGVRPHLRGKAKELAVYLACRPHGGDVDIICEILYPDSTVSKSLASVQQAVTSLRKVLTHHTTLRGNPILLSGDRYRLNPDLVTVDLWQLHHLTSSASAATDPQTRQTLLEHATRLGAEPLAPELDNDWIDAYRVTTAIATVEAHTALADLLTPTDPHRAATLLATAIAADPGNEALYRQRMRLQAQLGQHDAVRATMRELTQVLADLDTTPAAETQQLVATLLAAASGTADHGHRAERPGQPTRKGPATPTLSQPTATTSVHKPRHGKDPVTRPTHQGM